MGFFVKDLPQICCKTWEMHFLKILDHVICTNNQFVSYEKVSIHLFEKYKFLPIQLETGQIWTTGAS